MENAKVFGVAELAQRWGVTKQRAEQIASKRLGTPWRTLMMGRLWNEAQVKNFEKKWPRKSGLHIDSPWN